MPTALLGIKTIVQKVYDILKADSRTADINWHLGARTLKGIQELPAGGVSLGSGSNIPVLIPKTRDSTLVVLIQILYASEAGIVDAEQRMQDGLDNVIAVLADKPDLDLVQVHYHELEIETDSNPEAAAPTATALIRAKLAVRAM